MAGGGTWTTPKTWAAATLAATDMNTHIRDNDNALSDATTVITTTGTQTALAIPTGRGNLIIFANNASLLTLQGIAAPSWDGQLLTIFSIGAGQVDLANQNGSASAGNRIINGVTGTISLAAGSGRVVLRYDITTVRWRVLDHEQGAWITPTFAAGDYTASAGNWTVDSADVSVFAYRLEGRTLSIIYNISNTDVSATPTNLRRAIPGGFVVAKRLIGSSFYTDASATNVLGYVDVNPAVSSGALMQFFKLDGSAYTTTASDNTSVFGAATFEVT